MSPTDEVLQATHRVHFRTSSATVYEVQPGLWLVVPVPGFMDDEESATVSMLACQGHLQNEEHPVIVIILVDRFAGQTRGARKVHASWGLGSIDRWILVQGTALSRAIVAFFARISRPAVPIQVAPSLDEAFEIARARLPDLGWPAS